MLVAVVASIIALIVVAIAVVIFLLWRNSQKGSHATQKRSKQVQNINSVGVSSSLNGKKTTTVRPDVTRSADAKTASSARTRFAAMGVFAAAVFGAIAVKVGSMQLFASSEYEREADENLHRTVATPAPRGLIYDADGIALVKNKATQVVLADAEVAADRDVIQRLSALLGIPHNIVRQRILDSSSGAQSQRVVADNVTLRNVAFIAEHPEAFPGIATESRTIREYPYGALAAHVLGYTGPITQEDLAVTTEGVEHELGDTIGLSGVEAYYETLLAGAHGKRTVVADADGSVRDVISETAPTKGNDLYLTIKSPVQKVADKALAGLIAPKGAIGSGKGTAGSLVCLDVRTGGVVAMASYPTYTPESFIGGITTDVWDSLRTEESHYPLTNRAISGEYPAASTFKAFTGLAGLEYKFGDKEKKWECGGTWYGFGVEYPQSCWLLSGHGSLGFRDGVVVSCDVVFYEIAKDFYNARATLGETAMQDFIKRYGFAAKSGIDLGGETAGRIPTPEWKTEYFRDVPEERSWRPGDMSNMSIGQGYVLVTPLQMALGYAAVATGNLLKPHVLGEVKNSDGNTVLSLGKEVVRVPDVKKENLDLMRDSLHGVSQEDTLVSRAFYAAGIDAASKTGTAEVFGKGDFAWFACYAPYDDPHFVVACVIEEGGAGAEAACPISVEILDAALQNEAGTLDQGVEYIAGSSGKTVEPSTDTSSSDGRTD